MMCVDAKRQSMQHIVKSTASIRRRLRSGKCWTHVPVSAREHKWSSTGRPSLHEAPTCFSAVDNPGGCAHEDACRQRQLAVLKTPLYPYPGKLRHMRACSNGVSSSRQAAGSAHCRSKARGGATPGGARPKAAQATRLAHAPVASSPAVSSRAGHGSRRPCCQTGPWLHRAGRAMVLAKRTLAAKGRRAIHTEGTPCGQVHVSQAGELRGDCSKQAWRLSSPFLAKVCGCQGLL